MTEREMYDRLLELAGECRHKYEEVTEYPNHVACLCTNCGETILRERRFLPLPAVGNGSQMSLGEMAEWWIGNHGDQADIRLLGDPDTGERVAQVYSCAEGLSGEGRGKRLELALGYALCAALDSGDYAGAANIILAAVDGAR